MLFVHIGHWLFNIHTLATVHIPLPSVLVKSVSSFALTSIGSHKSLTQIPRLSVGLELEDVGLPPEIVYKKSSVCVVT